MFSIVPMVTVNWGSSMSNRTEDIVFGGTYMTIGRVVRFPTLTG